MRVYIAVGGWNYEGYDEPMGVYSTKELAEEAIRRGYDGYDFRDVIECELDAATAPPEGKDYGGRDRDW